MRAALDTASVVTSLASLYCMYGADRPLTAVILICASFFMWLAA